MRRALSLLVVLAVCAMPIASSAQAPAGKTLDIYFIDTEGGQATLFVSPTGQTLLVDAGNSGERDLNRILEVLKVAGVKQIDHFWLTHYHGDHYGSLIDIAKQVPIKHLYDHGPSIEGDRPNIIKFQAAYAEFYKSIPRTIVKPGDKLAFTGTDTTTVMSDSVPLKTAIAKAPGAGRPNPLCADHKPRDESKVDPDNHHSAGFVMNYGRFRTIDLGDLTWSREFMLMCPNNPIGTVDLYLTNHHGLDQSGAPAFVHAIQPRVAIMNNGTRKGGAVQTFQTLETSPGPRGRLAAALVVRRWRGAQRAWCDDCEHRRRRDQLAADPRRRSDAACGSRRHGRAHAGALHQGDGAQRRLVHSDQQQERLFTNLRG